MRVSKFNLIYFKTDLIYTFLKAFRQVRLPSSSGYSDLEHPSYTVSQFKNYQSTLAHTTVLTSQNSPVVQSLPGTWLKWLKAASRASNDCTAFLPRCLWLSTFSFCPMAWVILHSKRATATGVYSRTEAAVLMSSGLAASRMSSSGSSERPRPSRTMMAKMMEAKLLSSFT